MTASIERASMVTSFAADLWPSEESRRRRALAGLFAAVVLPIPLVTASGLSVPLPGFVERMAFALVAPRGHEPPVASVSPRGVTITHIAGDTAPTTRALVSLASADAKAIGAAHRVVASARVTAVIPVAGGTARHVATPATSRSGAPADANRTTNVEPTSSNANGSGAGGKSGTSNAGGNSGGVAAGKSNAGGNSSTTGKGKSDAGGNSSAAAGGNSSAAAGSKSKAGGNSGTTNAGGSSSGAGNSASSNAGGNSASSNAGGAGASSNAGGNSADVANTSSNAGGNGGTTTPSASGAVVTPATGSGISTPGNSGGNATASAGGGGNAGGNGNGNPGGPKP